MIIEAKQRSRCGRCAGFLEEGEEIEWFPPIPGVAESTAFHVGQCPEAKPKKEQNAPQARDPEDYIVYRKCDNCGYEWTVKKTSPWATSPSFVCPPSQRDGSNLCKLYGNAA